MHSSPRGEWVQGNEPVGNYLLVWDVFLLPELSEQSACRGRAGAYREGMGGPARTGMEAGIPSDSC